MPDAESTPVLSPRRARLASFEHSYVLALRLRHENGIPQFIVRTGNPLQPFRTTSRAPDNDEAVLALVA
jgi:hypothetical protein